MDYPLFMGSRQLGKVQVLEDGLYLKISCRCQRPGEMIYRLSALCEGRQENLGILVPMGEGFGLDRRIPAKRLRGSTLEFLLRPSHDPMPEQFIPVSPEEPFQYLSRLKNAYLTTKNGQQGIMIPR